MKDSIIKHMNHEHEEALIVLVKYHNKIENAKNAKMLDLDNKGMKILVDKTQEVYVPFTKNTEFSEVQAELIGMLKVARKSLGIEKNQTVTMNDAINYIASFGSVILGTVNSKNDPNITYAPYLRYNEKNYIYISEIGVHYDNLKNNGKLELFFLEDESKAKVITARQRVTLKAKAAFMERDEKFEEIMDIFEEKAGNTMKVIRGMTDFHLVELTFLEGRFVKGFGQAYSISKDGKLEQLTSDKLEKKHKN